MDLPIELRFDDPGTLAQGDGATIADIDALIQVLQQRHDAILEQSQQYAQALNTGEDSKINLPLALRTTHEQHLNELKKQYEQQSAMFQLLQLRRNLALNPLSILDRKLDEQRVAQGAPEVQVRLY